jgi:hypothetical protein
MAVMVLTVTVVVGVVHGYLGQYSLFIPFQMVSEIQNIHMILPTQTGEGIDRFSKYL